jgi:hypothetical protein
MFENNFQKGNFTRGNNVTLNVLTTCSPQIAKASDFSLLKLQDFPQYLLIHIFFFERIFWSEKCKYGKLEIRDLFFAYCFLIFSFP